jgi:bla regulator protein blaR1
MLALMLLVVLAGACSAIGAAAAEWTLALRPQRAVRWVWATAMVVSVASPVVRLAMVSKTETARAAATMGESQSPEAAPSSNAHDEERREQAAAATRRSAPDIVRDIASAQLASVPAVPLPRASSRTSRLIGVAWLTTSLLLCLAFVWSFRRLARERKTWRNATLHDTDVLVSESVGPALIGVRRPVIVLPSWVLQLNADSAKTILTHEREHRRVGDSRLIAAARLLCIAIPWNPFLWWMTNRLVRAIEYDCDARVLSHGIGAAAYADVLLSAQRHGAQLRRLIVLTAFAEHNSRLGARINHLLRPEPQGVGLKTLIGGTVAVALASLAIAAPIQQAAIAESVRLVVIDGDSVRADLKTEELQGEEYRARSGDRVIAIESWLDPANARRM